MYYTFIIYFRFQNPKSSQALFLFLDQARGVFLLMGGNKNWTEDLYLFYYQVEIYHI